MPRSSRPALRAALLTPLSLTLLASSVAVTVLGTASPAAVRTASDSYATSAVLPFDKPSTATLRASAKKVFANWVVSLPMSIDNKPAAEDYYTRHYLAPEGENGKHRSYGGWLRDRPLPRPVRTGNWLLEDMKSQVQQAISVGIDGFTMVLYSVPADPASTADANWNRARTMMQAAAAVDPGFEIVLMPDMTALTTVTAEQLARGLAYLGTFSSAYRTAEGRLLLSPFTPERRTPAWWQEVMSRMQTSHASAAALWPTLLAERPNRDAFAPISVGMSMWGSRDAVSNATDPDGTQKQRIREIHALGKPWMQPISLQDSRPRVGKFYESQNLQTLRNTWDIAIAGGADWAQLMTWNDLPEHTGILPSTHHGWSHLDLMAYYTTWFKRGVAPPIVRDAVYLSHRKHFVADKPTYPQSLLMQVTGATQARDSVEAMVFLTAPATVLVSVGSTTYSCQQPAGISACTVPLGTGTVKASVVREGGIQTTTVTSPWPVTRTPQVQDLQYVTVSSLREGSSQPTPVTLPPTQAPPASPATVVASADTYANQGAPAANYATSSQLMVRGGTGATSYLRFAMPPAPAGHTLSGARLTVRTTTDSTAGSAAAATVVPVTGAWQEGTVTWNNRPAVGSSAIATIPAGTRPDTEYTVALGTAQVAAAQGRSLDLALGTGSADDLRLWSTGHGSSRMHPVVTLTYAPTPTSTPAPAVLTPAADTYANQAAGATTYGGSAQLVVRGDPGGVSYLRFSVPAAPAGRTLASARLTVRTTTDATAGSAVAATFVPVTSGWQEGTLSWSNRPTLGGTTLGTVPAGTRPDTEYAVALSAAQVATAQGGTLDLAVVSTGSDDLRLWSTGHASSRMHPVLSLTYR